MMNKMAAVFTLVRNQIGWEENHAKEITTFISKFIYQTSIPAKEKKPLHGFKMAITSSLNKKKSALRISCGLNKMVNTTEYKRPFYLYCSETIRVNLSMNWHFLSKPHPGLFLRERRVLSVNRFTEEGMFSGRVFATL